MRKSFVRISSLRLLDILRFKNLPKNRDKIIEKAEALPIEASYTINEDAKALHPERQLLVVDSIVDYPECDAKTFWFRRKDGGKPAFFRAGQYVALRFDINGSSVTRPYSISSSPRLVDDEGTFSITVKRTQDGFVSSYLLSSLKVGDEVSCSGPQGQFCYESLRDARHVVALAGGSGITPFLSMAYAIRDGYEDFKLTILYGSRHSGVILFLKELEEIAAATEKVKVIHVLSEESHEHHEEGFLTADLIRKYAGGGDYSLFLCGPEGMYRFLEKEVASLGLPPRRIRREVMGMKAPSGENAQRYRLVVQQCGTVTEGRASSSETLLTSLERMGVKAPSRCRSGECGWCRSHLLSGAVTTPTEDFRRATDKEMDEIHPCCVYPLSDITLSVPCADN